MGSGTASGSAALVRTGTGVAVPSTGFQEEPFLIVANSHFSKPTVLGAAFWWGSDFTPPAQGESQRGINESNTFVGAMSTSGATTSTATTSTAPARKDNPYTAVDYVGISPWPAIVGPRNVPGLSQYEYTLGNLPAGLVSSASWSATGGGTVVYQDAELAVVEYSNTAAQVVTLSASATMVGGGTVAVQPAQVAVVMVTVGSASLTYPGLPGSDFGYSYSCLFQTNGSCTTFHDPGSDYTAFRYSGSYAALEDCDGILSSTSGTAWTVSCSVTVTAPVGREDAIGKIEVGFIQNATEPSRGTASYGSGTLGSSSGTLVRNESTAATTGLDWLFGSTGPGPTDLWPWYDSSAMAVPVAPSGSNACALTLRMSDGPSYGIPSRWNPTNSSSGSVPPYSNGLVAANVAKQFVSQIAAHTTERACNAYKHYFQYTSAALTVKARWTVDPTASIVTPPPGNQWSWTAAPTHIPVDVTPAIILWAPRPAGGQGFEMWDPQLNPSPP